MDGREQPIDDVMTHPVRSVTPDTPAREAATVLLDEGIGSVVVADAEPADVTPDEAAAADDEEGRHTTEYDPARLVVSGVGRRRGVGEKKRVTGAQRRRNPRSA
jgi:hypothetical protein